MPRSDGTKCHDPMFFKCRVSSQRFNSPLPPSSRGSLVSLSAIRMVSPTHLTLARPKRVCSNSPGGAPSAKNQTHQLKHQQRKEPVHASAAVCSANPCGWGLANQTAERHPELLFSSLFSLCTVLSSFGGAGLEAPQLAGTLKLT